MYHSQHKIVNKLRTFPRIILYCVGNTHFIFCIWQCRHLCSQLIHVVWSYSSEIRVLCLMKWPSETLQNLPYFWNTKTHAIHIVFFPFSIVLLYFFAYWMPWSTYVKTVVRTERWKKLWVFIFQKYGKFGSVSLGHFIKLKPLISEQWSINSLQCKYFSSQ